MADDETIDKETGEKKPGTSHTWAESYRDIRDMQKPAAKAEPSRMADKPIRQTDNAPRSKSTQAWLDAGAARDKASKLPKTRKKAAR